MFRDRLVLLCLGCVLLTYATEITNIGKCPSAPKIKPLEEAALSELDGFYYVVGSYSQNPRLDSVTCPRFRFTPRNENITDVNFRYKIGGLLPGVSDYYIQTTQINGSYARKLPILNTYWGQMYVLGTKDNVTVLYTCRSDSIFYTQDVYVLSENTTYPVETQEFVKETLKNNTLDYGYVRTQQQGDEQCSGVMDP